MASDNTFEDIWTRTGLAEAVDVAPGETLRGSASGLQTATHLPHLSIGVHRAEGPPVTSQLVIEGLLGEGGMGQVHLAHEPLLQRRVAIKRVRPDAPPGAAATLFREARIMGSLDHPNILPVHALGADDDGKPILVMKRIQGVEWSELISGPADHPAWTWFAGVSTDPIARHVEVLIQLCGAVHFAHERGVLHLDLKPDNAMLAEDGGLYVLDWGIARPMDGSTRRALAGTPAFMAPEMVDLGRPLGRATDVYLLGGCLHQVLCGRPPHGGDSLKEVLAAAHEARPPTLEGPAALAEVCARCLAADPADRYASVAELRDALVHWIRTRGSAELVALADGAARTLVEAIASEEPDPVAISRSFAEARFGYGRALEQWTENHAARTGQQSVLRAMTAFEIGRENLDSARALLDELDDPGSLQQALRQATERVADRRALEHDADLGVARSQRTAFVVSLGIVGLMITVGVLGGVLGDPGQLTARDTVWIGLFFNVVIVAFGWFGRAWLFQNAVNASITWSVGVIGVTVLVGRWATWQLDRPVPEVFAGDMMLMACGLGVGWAFLRHRGLAVAAVLSAAGGVVATLFPHLALATFGTVTTSGLLLGGVYWYTLERKRG